MSPLVDHIITGVMALPKIHPEVLWGLQGVESPQVTSVIIGTKGAKYHAHEICLCALVSPRCLPLVDFRVPPWLLLDMPKHFSMGNPHPSCFLFKGGDDSEGEVEYRPPESNQVCSHIKVPQLLTEMLLILSRLRIVAFLSSTYILALAYYYS